MTPTDNDGLATTEQVAARLHRSVAAVTQMRSRSEGPAYIKIGRRVFYRWEDIDAYLTEHTVTFPAGSARVAE
ncbi:helix-turn-helix transcriptional regulator [Diaminobutyricibacter sp. McL0618]|uniref:helix-turn-helix transcriptional regulator n=1 Tax=Leifsonia sp. McL0618 TaxID=3415677 RepID=UPI003CE811C8